MSNGKCCTASPPTRSVAISAARPKHLLAITTWAWRDSTGRARQRRRGLRAPGRRAAPALLAPAAMNHERPGSAFAVAQDALIMPRASACHGGWPASLHP
jgi:hypothetical protein